MVRVCASSGSGAEDAGCNSDASERHGAPAACGRHAGIITIHLRGKTAAEARK